MSTKKEKKPKKSKKEKPKKKTKSKTKSRAKSKSKKLEESETKTETIDELDVDTIQDTENQEPEEEEIVNESDEDKLEEEDYTEVEEEDGLIEEEEEEQLDDNSFFKEDYDLLNNDDNVNNRVTDNKLTIYEKTRIIGTRATQIANGAKPFVKNIKNLTPIQIAELELENKLCPIILARPLPNGVIEEWNVNELI